MGGRIDADASRLGPVVDHAPTGAAPRRRGGGRGRRERRRGVRCPGGDDRRACWRMDERSGTSMLDSARGHTGTLHGGISLFQPGWHGLSASYLFSGSGSYVSVPSAADLNPGSATITIGLHLKTTSAPASPDWDLIRKGLYTTSGGEWKHGVPADGAGVLRLQGSSGYAELQAGPSLKDGKFHFVQCVKTSTQIKVVVDGVSYAKSAKVGIDRQQHRDRRGRAPGLGVLQGLPRRGEHRRRVARASDRRCPGRRSRPPRAGRGRRRRRPCPGPRCRRSGTRCRPCPRCRSPRRRRRGSARRSSGSC